MDFTDAYMKNANLTDTTLNGTNFTDAYMKGADFSDANGIGNKLGARSLADANFLCELKFSGKATGTSFLGSNWRDATVERVISVRPTSIKRTLKARLSSRQICGQRSCEVRHGRAQKLRAVTSREPWATRRRCTGRLTGTNCGTANPFAERLSLRWSLFDPPSA